jgi:hypothetical protein
VTERLLGLLGMAAILAIAFLFSTNKRAIRPRVVAAAFALQAGIAFLVLYTSWGRAGIAALSNGVANLLGYANKGTEFLFGPSANNPLANTFAIAALPVIIFFAALVAVLYYLGIMQRIVRWVGGAIGWVTGISRVESLGSAANIFVGQSESPLVVRPYLAALPPSRLFTLMAVGMAGVAGTILAAYASLLGERFLPYLLAAAFMSAPGGILMAKIIMPDDPPAKDELPLQGGDMQEEKARRRRRRDGAGVRCPGGARQRAARRRRRMVRLSATVVPADRWLAVPARDVPDRHSLERGGDRRRPVRHQDRAQRIRRLHRSWRDAGRGALRADARDCHLRAVRLRQLQLDRDSDGGDRRACTQPAAGDRAAWASRLARRKPRQPDERGPRRAHASVLIVIARSAATRRSSPGLLRFARNDV